MGCSLLVAVVGHLVFVNTFGSGTGRSAFVDGFETKIAFVIVAHGERVGMRWECCHDYVTSFVVRLDNLGVYTTPKVRDGICGWWGGFTLMEGVAGLHLPDCPADPPPCKQWKHRQLDWRS